MSDHAENVPPEPKPPTEGTTPGPLVKPNYGPILEAGAQELEARLAELTVEQPDALVAGTALQERALRARDFVARKQREEAELLQAALADVRGRWGSWRERFDRLASGAKAFVGMRLAHEAAAEAEERKRREAALAEARAAAETAKLDTPEGLGVLSGLRRARGLLDELPPAGAPRAARTESGTQFTTKKWDYEVVQEHLVPDEYLRRVVDPDKVMAAVGRGVRDIPGIRIYEAETTVFRRNRGRKR